MTALPSLTAPISKPSSANLEGDPAARPPLLVPAPRRMAMQEGRFEVQPGLLTIMDSWNPRALRPTAARFHKAMRKTLGFSWDLSAATAVPASQVGLVLQLSPQAGFKPQGYRLTITPHSIRAAAGDEAGLFYAVCTLVQLLDQYKAWLPCLEISDWPDFPARGVMLDISRDKVYTLETLFELVDLLAGWKINQLQLYTEHTFAYRRHSSVWAAASPLTGEEIMELDVYCRERQMELVPNQNSFGHLHRWLTHPQYAHLGEVVEGFQAPWGYLEGPFSLCPTDPRSFEFISELYDELLPHFSSRMVNVGCDETFDLGQGRSKEAVSSRGVGQVYLEFLTSLHHHLKQRGYTMQFWGDIVSQHPELIPFLPRDLIALEWGYEHNHPFAENTARYAQAGIPFYVCPGTSSWSSLAGRSNNALANLLSAAEHGLNNGAIGYLITDWGDNGHWQFLPVSYLGFAAGASYAWALDANRSLDVPSALSCFAYRDEASLMGKLAFDLGNVYEALGIEWINASALFSILQRTLAVLGVHPKIRSIPYEQVLDAIERAVQPLEQALMDRPDAALIQREFALTARLMRHACRRGQLAVMLMSESGEPLAASPEAVELAEQLDCDMAEIIPEYQELWLRRSRPGGLADSAARFEKARKDYALASAIF